MARLSREKKREQKQAARAATPAAPIDVRVPGAGADPAGADPAAAGRGAGAGGVSDGASVGGVPVFAAPGEEIQQAVLNRLHHIALATGHPVLATIHDERIGYVVPLQVDPDGSSRFTAEPVRTAPPDDAVAAAGTPAAGTATKPPVPPPGPTPPVPPPGPTPPAPEPEPEPQHPQDDRVTHVLRPVPEPGRGPASTFPLRAVPEPQPADQPVPTFELRAVPEPPQSEPEDAPPGPATTPPGTVAPPTGEFGPPPLMDVRPLPVPGTGPAPHRRREPEPMSEAELLAAEADAKPTPARGFDAVAEAVLGDEPLGAPDDPAAPALLAEPIARINEAVKEGRIDAAAGLADRTVVEASGTLGPEHPEVLRLRELTAYISYLAGDPLRAFHLSLDLAGARRRSGDAEAAYGNVQSAATAWRAVRDPAVGLELGRDLIGLWTELAAEDGPAAEEIEQLESARARMGRLTERARNQ
ncbi:tetratricopeptide repeat protein [Streptomyces sp. HP-A2021]|uniref:tetratricopeptide repeat protein n=1 Tax=Streptomyces sp. HP-A2021 TaxID=2927875 RepID=UPI001FAEB5A4|nr:tetratricopeptide repeat protein [Streptomyces sp. HP-A2021]UOB10931.1 tetratricopeptide repeat protein [Streptomyces sp. HP-A2021]